MSKFRLIKRVTNNLTKYVIQRKGFFGWDDENYYTDLVRATDMYNYKSGYEIITEEVLLENGK